MSQLLSERVSWAHWRRLPSRARLIVVLVAVYAILTIGVLIPGSPILSLDSALLGLKLHHHPDLMRKLDQYVVLGQRKPAIRVFFPFFVWVALRKRSAMPLILLTVSLLLLNVTVGVVKLATGRLGPRATHDVHAIFVPGGDIYPSGHVSNAVVLFGMMAVLALRFRRTTAAAAVFLSVTIGISTLFLGTHWFSDVLGGWLAGGLVLLAVLLGMPAMERAKDVVVAWARSGVDRFVAVTAATGFVCAITLSWVYVDIRWTVPLGVGTAVVMVLLIVPAVVRSVWTRSHPRTRASAPVEDVRPSRAPAARHRTATAVQRMTVRDRDGDSRERDSASIGSGS